MNGISIRAAVVYDIVDCIGVINGVLTESEPPTVAVRVGDATSW